MDRKWAYGPILYMTFDVYWLDRLAGHFIRRPILE